MYYLLWQSNLGKMWESFYDFSTAEDEGKRLGIPYLIIWQAAKKTEHTF